MAEGSGRRFLAPGVLLLALGLPACDGASTPDAPKPVPGAPRDVLVIAVASDAHDLLQPVSESAADAPVIEAMQLAPMDAEFECRLAFEPELASSWEFAPDGLTLEMRLRTDIQWPDGTPVGAEDVRAAYALIADPAVASPRRDVLGHFVDGAAPEVVDAHTLRFRYTHAYDRATMLSHANLAPVPRHLLGPPAVDPRLIREHPANTVEPVASGPFRLDHWTRGEELVLVPNPGFSGPREFQAKLRQVVFRVIPDYAARVTELLAGRVDLVDQLQVEDADRLKRERPEYVLARRGWRSLDYLAWNELDPADVRARAAGGGRVDPAEVARHPIFGDPELRKALTAAVDVNQLIRELLTSEVTGEVYGRPAVGTVSPALCGVHADTLVTVPFDPDAAGRRLGELGWVDSNGDGWRDRGGVELRFTVLTNDGNPRRTRAAERIKEGFARIGVDMRVEVLQPATFFDRLRSRDFEAALTGGSASLFADSSAYWAPDGAFNFTGYANPRVTELLAQALAEPDHDRARPLWLEMQRLVYADQPYTFLYWLDEIVAVHGRFQNTRVDLLAPYRQLHRWSVRLDKVKYKD